VLTLSLPMACPELCNKPPFSAFTRPLHLVSRDGWPDLACGISGDQALDPKLRFNFGGGSSRVCGWGVLRRGRWKGSGGGTLLAPDLGAQSRLGHVDCEVPIS
jgi:hypothetical protein